MALSAARWMHCAILAVALLGGISTANAVPPAPPSAMNLGDDFTTLFVTCGTAQNPECPRWLAPVGRPFLIHYVLLGGRSEQTCSGTVLIKRTSKDGSEVVFQISRLVFDTYPSSDNLAFSLAKPIRVRADDVVGVSRNATDCAVNAVLGIELTK